MKILRVTKRLLLFVILGLAVPGAFGAGTEITRLDAVPDGDALRIEIDLTSPANPIVHSAGETGLLVLDFPNVAPHSTSRRIMVNHAGIGGVHLAMHSSAPLDTWLVVGVDSVRPLDIETDRNKVVVRILPHSTQANAPAGNIQDLDLRPPDDTVKKLIATRNAPPLKVEPILAASEIDDTPVDSPATVRHRFKVRFISGSTVYIDGGSNAGLRVGMNLDILSAAANHHQDSQTEPPIGTARIVGIATTSAILEVDSASGDLKIGDLADLLPGDADTASQNVMAGPDNTLHAADRFIDDDDASHRSVGAPGQRLRSTRTLPDEARTRTAGRIGFDYSGISSAGSTPGTSLQLGMSFQSNIQHILGTHWNLEGYWRGRINRHSQFQEPTIQDSLNKTYTMQLYYDNPNSPWVAGMGRLYLPWAVSLDTIDGGYFGHKFALGNTTGVFAGSTPDLSSWHFRPNQRIGGVFTNFEGGDYDRLHYSSTTGVGLTSIKWKLDRPFVFFENELSYKGKISAYHSLIVDSPQGVTTNGIRPGAGVSHSYFTLHYRPMTVVSFDLYHNFFRDVPTAVTTTVGTGLVDKLLFQGISAGTHVMPNRHFTLYTTLGASDKTGDAHPSLNEMFGATWNEIAHTGLRADFHYSKFDSNFGNGHYEVLSLSRQLTNRMFWSVQLGKQDVESSHTLDCFSNFVDDSFDVNLGRHSYLQSGYTYVKGDTMNYRQWYMSWGYRLDEGKKNPQYVQTVVPRS